MCDVIVELQYLSISNAQGKLFKVHQNFGKDVHSLQYTVSAKKFKTSLLLEVYYNQTHNRTVSVK